MAVFVSTAAVPEVSATFARFVVRVVSAAARAVASVVSAVARVAASSATCFWIEPAVAALARRFDTVPLAPPVATVAVFVSTAVVPEVSATFARLVATRARAVASVVSAVARVVASSATCFWMEPAVVASARRFDTVPVAPPVATVTVFFRTAAVPVVSATLARFVLNAVRSVPVDAKKAAAVMPPTLPGKPVIPALPLTIRET